MQYNSRSTLKALSRSCRYFRHVTLPALFYSIHLHFLPEQGNTGHWILRDMLSNDNVTICECVRVLIVSGFQYDPGEDTYLLQFLIQRLTKLQTIG